MGDAACGYLPPGQGPDLGMQQRLVAFHDRDEMRLLVLDQPVQVRPHCVEGVGCHHGAVQVQRSQDLGEVAGLVVLDADLEVVQQASAMPGDAEQVDPGAVGAASAAGCLAVHGHGPQPVPGQRLGLLGGAPGTVSARAGRGRLKVVVDNNVSTPVTVNQDEIYLVPSAEAHLFEEPNSPVYIRAEQPSAAKLAVLYVCWGYYGFTFDRYGAGSMQKVAGTGLTTPTF